MMSAGLVVLVLVLVLVAVLGIGILPVLRNVLVDEVVGLVEVQSAGNGRGPMAAMLILERAERAARCFHYSEA